MPRHIITVKLLKVKDLDGENAERPRKRKLYVQVNYDSNDSIYDIRPLRTDRKQWNNIHT